MHHAAKQLVLIVVLSVLALAASASMAAAAPTFTAASYPSTTSGVQVEPFVVTTGQGQVKCPGITYSGEQKEALSEITLVAFVEFWECSTIGLGTTIRQNGCEFIAKATTVVAENMLYGGTLAIACPPGKSIEFIGGGGICIVSLPSQSGAIELEDQTSASPEDVLMKVNVTNLKYTLSGSFLCKGSFENGTLGGSVTLKSLNGAKTAQAFMVGGK
ncbi:MAG TPA: hypothetical protein VFI03_00085 [Solirubrobacterales bacterium]|nr:hypothetical protein [Solirubrobacterales bacterium]